MAKPEKTNMSKTNDTKPRIDHDLGGGGRLLRSEELEHVSGGMDLRGLSEAMTQRAEQLVPGLVVVR
jgi:hypothetical protein